MWFRIKFLLLVLCALAIGLTILPAEYRIFLPESMQEALDKDFKLGIDLSGGTQLEYKIDFSEAEKKATLSTDETFVIDKGQIASGVVETLKKRIDPDGTKEVSVFSSQRDSEWFVTVEMTADIDTPENRAKLEKITSLSFLERGDNLSSSRLISTFDSSQSFEEITQKLISESKGYANPFDLVDMDSLIAAIGASNADTVFFGLTKEMEGNWYPGGFDVEGSPYHQMLLYIKEVSDDEKSFVIQSFAYQLWNETGLGGGQFDNAKVGTDANTNYPVTNINFTPAGGLLFGKLTGELSERNTAECGQGDIFAISVDNVIISAPCVSQRIDGNAQISFGGGGDIQSVQREASQLAESLNSGATPAPVELASERKISASLGETALELSLKAALLGFFAVALWMMWFYRWFGFLAVLALTFYAIVLLALFKSLGFVLTLSGVAGVILSVGMAVDANVLIFERIREELRDGQSFQNAVAEGFDRAWTSIRDSNTSSLLICFILFGLGTSIIKGFAITLGLGILVSMFTAIVFTRYLVKGLTPKILQEKLGVVVGK